MAKSTGTNTITLFCERPGCPKPRRASEGHLSLYCGKACREAVCEAKDRKLARVMAPRTSWRGSRHGSRHD